MEGHRSRILLVEDDPALAGRMVSLLRAAYYEVDGPHGCASDGLAALARHFPDGAVIDLHGGLQAADLLKEDLAAYDVPFLEGEGGALGSCHPGRIEGRLRSWLRCVRH